MLPLLATTFEMYCVLGIVILLAIGIVVIVIIQQHKEEKERVRLLELIKNRLDLYKSIEIGMDEDTMIRKMIVKYDLTRSEVGNSYRFVYMQRGGSGSTSGSIAGWNNRRDWGLNMFGSIKGSQETHDESVVIIECQNNKVTKVAPYNMSSFELPSSYNDVVAFAKYLNIPTK